MLTAAPPACSPVRAPAPRAETAWALDSGHTLPSDPKAKAGLRVSGRRGQKSCPFQALGDSGEGPLPWSCRAGVTWGWMAPRDREWGPQWPRMAQPGGSSWDPGAIGGQCGVKPGGHRQPAPPMWGALRCLAWGRHWCPGQGIGSHTETGPDGSVPDTAIGDRE